MDVIKLLEYLEEIIDSATKLPVTNKVLIDKKEVLDILEQIMSCLPDEFKKAQWIVEEKERIINEAMQESESINKQNMEMIQKKIDNHSIVKEAQVKAQEIINSAQRDAKSMRLGARDYADEILTQVEKEINAKGEKMTLELQQKMEEFLKDFHKGITSTSNTMRENIKELRNMK